MEPIHVVIVTHNSDLVLSNCLQHLALQSICPTSVIIVDCGSDSVPDVSHFSRKLNVHVDATTNLGFSKANNRGAAMIRERNEGLLIFLNPDCFLPPQALEKTQSILSSMQEHVVLGPKLLGIDTSTMRGTGRIDSAGIFRSPLGRWYDRGHGRRDRSTFDQQMEVPALCGAMLCARMSSWNELGDNIFDSDFFLYKEDIELGLRLRSLGWKMIYHPEVHAFHGRGWKGKRKKIPRRLRLTAARSEILLYKKHPSFYMIWAISKYIGVRYGGL